VNFYKPLACPVFRRDKICATAPPENDVITPILGGVRERQPLRRIFAIDVPQTFAKEDEATELSCSSNGFEADLDLIAEEGDGRLRWLTKVIFNVQRDNHLRSQPHSTHRLLPTPEQVARIASPMFDGGSNLLRCFHERSICQ
jgi:hypothetical protein